LFNTSLLTPGIETFVYDDHDKLTADRHQVNRIKYLMCAVSEGSGLSNKNIISLYTRDH
jgi:hypothetical protein